MAVFAVLEWLARGLAAFPHESVPDGHIGAPHHLYVGVGLLVATVAVVMDNYRRREPVLAGAGALLALFSFATVWPFYPPVGAAGALAGLALAAGGVASPWGFWEDVSRRARLTAALGVLIASDDVVEHAFGVATPLDELWINIIHPIIT